MNKKSLLTGILIGAIVLPTVSLGGTFVSSLIAGKTPAEAVEIIATQVDNLIGRVGVIETKQDELEGLISASKSESEKLKLCKDWNKYLESKEKIDYYIANGLINPDLSIIDPLANGSPNQLDQEKYNQILSNYQQYLNLLSACNSF